MRFKDTLKLFPLLVGILLLPGGRDAAAQDRREETLFFQQAAGMRTVLLRGKQAARYDYPANGNPYWISAEYLNGEVEVEDKRYYDVPFNIDAVTQRLLVRVGDSQVAVALPPGRVKTIDADGRHFVGIGTDGPLPEGFYEDIGTGAETKASIKSSPSISAISRIPASREINSVERTKGSESRTC